jgi:arylsulfatase A-like enzyme
VSTTTPADGGTSRAGSAGTPVARRCLGPRDVLMLSACCGLGSGLLEVGTRVLCRYFDPTNRLYMLSRHFVWLAPLSTLLLFTGLGLFLALGTRIWPRRGAWFSTRFICFWAILPVLMVASPRIYPAAWVILAMGTASWLVWILERHATRLRRRLMLSFPALLASVLLLATLVFGGDWLKARREAARPVPPPDSPNVLLVVLDTVRADRLSLYGYERRTSPALERAAKRGIRFDEARATAPWTLASHASFFTGRWPHELGVKWLTPLAGSFPTLAEYLGSRGYATAGFVANTLYCSYETGLDRGFTHYEDYVLKQLMPFRTAWLVDHALQITSDWGMFCARTFDVGPFRPMQESWFASLFVVDHRKDARAICRGFVDWLARRREPARPFFAFLNFYDAHAPYVLPRGADYRFGIKPQKAADFIFLMEYWESLDKMSLREVYRKLARDSYDNCVTYLDERLGELFAELEQRGVLDQTLVIVTSDHGEGLGEHELFDHGESLYRNEIRVPLLFVLPSRTESHGVVRDTVSLRDLPATIVDLVGLGGGAPFSGRSLARMWRDSSPEAGPVAPEEAISELPRPNPFNPNQGRSPAHRGPLVSVAEGDFVYIRNERDGTEEFFNERDDPNELHNQAQVEAMQPMLIRFRRRLDLMKANETPR